jgi:hypothetical protein
VPASGRTLWQCAASVRKEVVCNKIDFCYSTSLLSGTTPVAIWPKPPARRGEAELHARERVVEAHGGSSVGVGGIVRRAKAVF